MRSFLYALKEKLHGWSVMASDIDMGLSREEDMNEEERDLKTKHESMYSCQYVHTQLGDRHPTIPRLSPVPIFPNRLAELRTRHHNLADGYTRLCLDWLNHRMDPRIESKHQACVVAVEDQVTPRH